MSYLIENITQKDVNTKFGPKPAYSIVANGDRFSYGFKKPAFKIGDTIDFQFTENIYGKTVDLTSVRLLTKGDDRAITVTTTGTGTGKAPYSPPTRPFPIPALHGDRAIVRQNSITNATKLVVDSVVSVGECDWEALAQEVINVARMFEAYSCGDLDMEQAVAMAEAKE